MLHLVTATATEWTAIAVWPLENLKVSVIKRKLD